MVEVITAPAFERVPSHAQGTNGPAAADLAEMAGIVLDHEQRIALDAILSVDQDGRWAAIDSAIVCPRQNGKTVVLQVIALADLFLFDARLVMWTAHLFPTAQEAFRDLDGIIGGTPELARRVKRISRADGEEGFELLGGQRLRFKARSKTGGRGLTGDRVILDEAFALGAAEIGSLYPTLSARPNPSVVYASSAGMMNSSVLRSLRDRGRPGDDALVWIEWCAADGDCAADRCDHRPGAPGCVLDDRDRWQQANFAVGRRITARYLESERKALPPDEFMRERLGWWEDPIEGASGISEETWNARKDLAAEFVEPVTIGVDVTPNFTAGAIAACGGPLHIDAHGRGTSWIVDALVDLRDGTADKPPKNIAAVGLDPTSPAAALIPDLEKAGFTVRNAKNPDGLLVLLDGRESVQACEQFLAGVLDGTLIHRDQYVLNTAVRDAGRRVVGDSWKWSRRDSTGDISPLVAATVARYLWVQPEAAEAPKPSVAGDVDAAMFERTLAQIEEEERRALESLGPS